jgi:hypothetical protein
MGLLKAVTMTGVLVLAVAAGWLLSGPAGAQKADSQAPADWVEQIEKIFIRSEDCKQCHDRHYEEWKGAREQTPDLKTFGRVDAALLHGTSLESPIFRTVLGVWLQTNPTTDQKRQCLSCHVPSTTVFPQHVDKIANQVLAGKVQVEGIGCASCHLIHETSKDPAAPVPTFKLKPGKTLYGPYADPEENLVHPAAQSDLFRSVNFCASCHFDKVKDVTKRELPGEILQGTVCQDCHMEPSTGSSTSKRGSMTRAGVMLKNRNLQAEWMPRVDIEAARSGQVIQGTVLVRVGSLPHSFPDGDPILKQFFVTITAKDAKGQIVASEVKRFGLLFEQIARGPFPEPFIKGGTTRRVPFSLAFKAGVAPANLEAMLTYALVPEPSPALLERYLATLAGEKERADAVKLIQEYSQPRVLTFRTKAL